MCSQQVIMVLVAVTGLTMDCLKGRILPWDTGGGGGGGNTGENNSDLSSWTLRLVT